ncbi:MAG: hypothetical protein HYW78_03950 [Parcubacteria group bacterium]|nr:hypothetical protein [Parcubacteria group bacterium]
MEIYESKAGRMFKKITWIYKKFGLSGLILLALAVVLSVIAGEMFFNAYRWHEVAPVVTGSILSVAVAWLIYLVAENTARS